MLDWIYLLVLVYFNCQSDFHPCNKNLKKGTDMNNSANQARKPTPATLIITVIAAVIGSIVGTLVVQHLNRPVALG